MAIISVSLPDETIKEIERLQQEHKFSGRSELFRAAVTAFGQEDYRSAIEPSRHYTASVSVVIAETQKRQLHDTVHEFQGLIRTQSHLCVDADRCLEIYGTHGAGKELLAFLDALEALPKVSRVSVCSELCGNHRH